MKKNFKIKFSISILIWCVLTLSSQSAIAQFSTTASNNGTTLVNALLGTGAAVSNIQINCPGSSSGTFKGGNSSNLGLNEGILLTTGSVNLVARPASNFNDTNNNAGGDADINAIVTPLVSYDACKLEFDFEPVGSSLTFQYVFASEEYPEYACTNFTDAFAFLIDGPGYSNDNIALVPNSAIPVTINTVNNTPPNCVNNAQYYINNGSGTTVVYDGFTTVLTASAEVVPCESYHFKLVIADVNDRAYDSGVFLKKGSFNVGALCQNQTVTLNTNGTASITAQSLYSNNNPDCLNPTGYSASQTTFNCSDLGSNTVTLTVTYPGNQSATCQANVEVLDIDSDNDGISNCNDSCPLDPDNDADGDGICGNVDSCPLDADNDLDGDGVCGNVDNCPLFSNPDQTDTDVDGEGDVCDADDDNDGCMDEEDTNPLAYSGDSDGDGNHDDCDPCPYDALDDADGDGVCGDVDNCPTIANADQLDTDGDGNGDACDTDDDNDGCLDEDDANPLAYSGDSDGDGNHDDCDPCPFDALDDADGDGVCGDVDNCPTIANADQLDTDGDGNGDACDTDDDNDGCLDEDDANPVAYSGDSDGDGNHDDCDPCPFDAMDDADADGVCGDVDNCPTVANADQLDTDGDGLGNACDTDDDNDGCLDADDAFPTTASGDSDCDGIANDCDHCNGGDDNGPCDATTFPGMNNIPANWKCGNNNSKVKVCHSGTTLCISPNAVQAHLNHGDFLGPCTGCGNRDASGIVEDAHSLEFDLYPNPAANELNIELDGLGKSAATLTMLDPLGRVVLTKRFEPNTEHIQFVLPLSGIAVGKYFIRVITADEVQTKSLVISR